MQKLAIITQYFYPSSTSTGQLMTDLVRGLIDRGYEVKVITSGYSKTFVSADSFNQVVVPKSPSFNLHSHSILRKAINSLFFIASSFIQITFQLSGTTPLLIASNPPYVGVLGLCFRLLKRGKFYFLIQDIFPESAVLSDIIKPDSFSEYFFRYLTYITCRYSQHTVVLSSSMKEFLEQKFSILKDKQNIKVIENWSIADIYPCEKQNNDFAIQHNLTNTFTVLYSGNLGRLHDIESIAKSAKLLSDRPIQFAFIGDGPKQKILEHYVQENQLKNILLLPFQPRELISVSLTACDVSLVSLIEGADKIIAPCKLYGMLASGRAIVSISSPNSYIDQLITTYNCGVNCPPNQPEQLANILNELATDPWRVKAMGERAHQLYEKKYTFKRAIEEYEKLLF
ncbi:MAG: glycosyltransferase family 4 protein [Crinalium sp.]